jgi:hypothetical protein
MKDKKENEERVFTISTEIKCEGGNIVRDRKEEKEVGRPDAELPKAKMTKKEAAMIIGTFIIAFAAAFFIDLKMKARKEDKGEIEEIKFTLSDENEKPVDEKVVGREEIEEILKTATVAKK